MLNKTKHVCPRIMFDSPLGNLSLISWELTTTSEYIPISNLLWSNRFNILINIVHLNTNRAHARDLPAVRHFSTASGTAVRGGSICKFFACLLIKNLVYNWFLFFQCFINFDLDWKNHQVTKEMSPRNRNPVRGKLTSSLSNSKPGGINNLTFIWCNSLRSKFWLDASLTILRI